MQKLRDAVLEFISKAWSAVEEKQQKQKFYFLETQETARCYVKINRKLSICCRTTPLGGVKETNVLRPQV